MLNRPTFISISARIFVEVIKKANLFFPDVLENLPANMCENESHRGGELFLQCETI